MVTVSTGGLRSERAPHGRGGQRAIRTVAEDTDAARSARAGHTAHCLAGRSTDAAGAGTDLKHTVHMCVTQWNSKTDVRVLSFTRIRVERTKAGSAAIKDS